MKRDEWIFQAFIQEHAAMLPQELFFVDEEGIIFASSVSNREGLFHEAALHLMRQGLDQLVITGNEGWVGAEEGFCMPVVRDGKRCAVLCITGDPGRCAELERVLVIAVEAYLKASGSRYKPHGADEEQRQLLARGLYDNGYLRVSDMADLAEQLKIRSGWPFIPVIAKFADDGRAEELAGICRKLSGRRVILAEAVRQDQLLLLIAAEKKDQNLVRDYRFDIAGEVQRFLQYLRKEEIPYRLAVGSWQMTIEDLPAAVRHCRWLLREIRDTNRTTWFYDYMDEYFFSHVPAEELRAAYFVPDQILDTKQKEVYLELFEALVEENFNLDKAGARLHMHRNTLAYRLGKIRDSFGMNPLSNMRDRQFMTKYYLYLKKRKPF